MFVKYKKRFQPGRPPTMCKGSDAPFQKHQKVDQLLFNSVTWSFNMHTIQTLKKIKSILLMNTSYSLTIHKKCLSEMLENLLWQLRKDKESPCTTKSDMFGNLVESAYAILSYSVLLSNVLFCCLTSLKRKRWVG